MSGISLLKQRVREKMGTARGLSEIPEVSAAVVVDAEFVKHIAKMDKVTQAYVKCLRAGSSAANELANTNAEFGTNVQATLESYRKISTVLQAVSEYERELIQMWNDLAARIESDISSAFRSITHEALADAKQQISAFEKTRLASDAAASELSALQKASKPNEQKIEQAKASADAKRSEFLAMGEETSESLSHLHTSIEADTIDLLCTYIEILSNTFNNALRASNELVPLLFQTKSYIEELREKHAGTTHAQQTGELGAQAADRVFGRPLAEITTGDQIPVLVPTLIQYIESDHIDAEGLYWRSIPAPDLVSAKRGFNRLSGLPDPSVLATAEASSSLLKSFFRELPEPLLTYKLFSSFTESNNVRDAREKAEKLASVVNQLPPMNKRIAAKLFAHLHNVASNGATNLMSAGRLATAWATILLSSGAGTSIQEDPFEIRAVVESIIEWAPLVFAS